MVYKNVNITVLIHLLVIISFSFLAGYICFVPKNYTLIILIIPVLVMDISVIINLFNRTNRNLAYFFESIENDDNQLNFPTGVRNSSQKRLHESMNRVNKLISEIKLQNERNEQYYHSLIQQSATGLIAIGPDNKIEIVNTKACELAGISVARNFSRIQKRNPELWSVLCRIKPGETIAFKDLKEGILKHLSICATEIRFQEKSTKLISLQDIKHELDAREIESWQKLISILTHEIMNSIAPITSLSGTLKKFFQNDNAPVSSKTIADTIQGLEIIEDRGKGLINFISSYRKLTKIPPPVYSRFQAYEWLDNLRILLHEKLTQKEIAFEFSVDTQAKTIYGDIKLLTQVLINITNNAIDALSGKHNNRRIKIDVTLIGGRQTQIRISNNGPAIPENLIDKIFVPFFTTKENGSGIGLSLSRQIIQMHSGYIYPETNEAETSFVIIL